MSELEDQLRDAASGSVGFDHRDIARRVRRRRTNRLAAVAVLVVLGVVGIVAGLGDDVQVVDSVGPVEDGAVTADELIGHHWVAIAYSAVVVPPDPPPFVLFDDRGRVGGIDGCGIIDGEWELDGDRLATSLEDAQDIPCASTAAGVAEVLAADPTVGRFDDADGTLLLTAGEDFVAFQRFEDLGAAPTVELLDGTWTNGAPEDRGGAVTFTSGGTGRLEVLGCSQPFEWSLDGDALDIDGIDRNGIPCNGGVVGGSVHLTLASSPRVRVDDTLLWISSDLGIGLLHAAGG